MKKLLLILFLFTSITINSQKQFSGVWKCPESAYLTTVLSSEYKVLKVFNFSLIKHRFINETIIHQSKDTIKTKLYNKQNRYNVNIKYYLKNKDTLVNEYSGDYDQKILLTRLHINK